MSELDLTPYREQAKIYDGSDYPGTARMLRELCDEVERLRAALRSAYDTAPFPVWQPICDELGIERHEAAAYQRGAEAAFSAIENDALALRKALPWTGQIADAIIARVGHARDALPTTPPASAEVKPKITDHRFVARVIYPNGVTPPVTLPNRCGFVTHVPLNSALEDVDHCNRPPEDHAETEVKP